MTGLSISSDRRPYAAQQKALEASSKLREERDAINDEIQALTAKARKLSVQIRAVERETFKHFMGTD